MLKEVFVMEEGLLQYHYSKDQSAYEGDQALLSTGLLSALRDFSKQARADTLESFATENEYFLFTACEQSSRVIAGVFDRRAPQQVAEEALERIKKVVQQANLPDHTGETLSFEKKLELSTAIERIVTQLFGRESLARYIEDILSKRTDIPLAFVVDAYEKTLLAHFARPRPLFKDMQVKEFLLLHSTLLTTLGKLGFDNQYHSFTIESPDYVVSSCRGGRLLSVASGAMRTPCSNVESAAFQICYDNEDIQLPDKENAVSSSINVLFDNGIINNIRGEALPSNARIFLSTLVNNIDSLFRAINRRRFTRFEVRTGKEHPVTMVLKRDNGEKGIRVEIYKW